MEHRLAIKKPKHTNIKPDADDLSAVTGEASEKTKTSNGVTAAWGKGIKILNNQNLIHKSFKRGYIDPD